MNAYEPCDQLRFQDRRTHVDSNSNWCSQSRDFKWLGYYFILTNRLLIKAGASKTQVEIGYRFHQPVASFTNRKLIKTAVIEISPSFKS